VYQTNHGVSAGKLSGIVFVGETRAALILSQALTNLNLSTQNHSLFWSPWMYSCRHRTTKYGIKLFQPSTSVQICTGNLRQGSGVSRAPGPPAPFLRGERPKEKLSKRKLNVLKTASAARRNNRNPAPFFMNRTFLYIHPELESKWVIKSHPDLSQSQP